MLPAHQPSSLWGTTLSPCDPNVTRFGGRHLGNKQVIPRLPLALDQAWKQLAQFRGRAVRRTHTFEHWDPARWEMLTLQAPGTWQQIPVDPS